MKRMLLCASSLVFGVSSAFALNITVNPATGTTGSNPTDTIEDAFVQIAASVDAAHTITLDGASITTAVDAVWSVPAAETVDIVAASGRPVVVIADSTGRWSLKIYVPLDATLNVTGIAFVPAAGLSYAHNTDDAIGTWSDVTEDFNIPAGTQNFTDVIFGANDGSDGLAAVGPWAGYAGVVGDDWIQFASGGYVTFDNCLLTGSGDDAILFDGDGFDPVGATGPAELNLINGTVICETGGAGIQMYGGNTIVNLDGSGGRVSVINPGSRTGATDVAYKNFSSVMYQFVMDQADFIGTTNGGYFEFSHTDTVTISNSRIALCNSADVGTAANIALAGAAGAGTTITLTDVTVHDGLGATNAEGILYTSGDVPAWNITDCIISGASDIIDLGTGAVVTQTNNAVVASGPHALANPGVLTSTVTGDPGYISTGYTCGTRGVENVLFLQVTDSAYASAGITGGAPPIPPVSAASQWNMYE